jgi:DNA-binding transcriptional MerR regulator/uncharacterized protein YndB with AHSA1/START domain
MGREAPVVASTEPADGALRSGEVAERSGLTVDALRYYERQGLLIGDVERTEAGHRIYRDVDFEWLAICRRLRGAGTSVGRLRAYADLVRAADGSDRARLAILREQRAGAADTARDIDEALDLLDRKIAAYERALDGTPATSADPADAPTRAAAPGLFGEIDPARGLVTMRRAIPSDAASVWAMFTVPEHLGHWLGRVTDGAPGPGADFSLWHDEDTRSTHTVTVWEPVRRLDLTWDFPEEGRSTVSVELSDATEGADDDATLLTLRHDGVADAASYAAGWHRHLDYLIAYHAGAELPPGLFWDGHADIVARYASTARD